jgi:hypothetical protein
MHQTENIYQPQFSLEQKEIHKKNEKDILLPSTFALIISLDSSTPKVLGMRGSKEGSSNYESFVSFFYYLNS